MIDMDLQGGPYWKVPTGRRDGIISKGADTFVSLPAPFHNLTVLLTIFGNVGLDANDLVLLSGMPISTHKLNSVIIIASRWVRTGTPVPVRSFFLLH